MGVTEAIDQLVSAEIERYGVPGVAVVVVQQGEIVLARGWGQVAFDERPVTARTRYQIASDTKTFAAATAVMLADDGLFDLDRPVRDYLPWFGMYDDRLSGFVTTRDLLAHRTGLPRHDFFIIGDNEWTLSLEAAARGLRHLEPTAGFRERWGYNNAHVAAVGHLLEQLTGTPWPRLVRDLILDPLGMSDTSTYSPASTDDMAPPYHLDLYDVGLGVHRVPFHNREYTEPNGSLVSNAADMGKWLLARLGHPVNGRRVLSSAVLEQLHMPCVLMPPRPGVPAKPLGYGLGVMVSSYNDSTVLHHGGGAVGYRSDVMVMPEMDAGVAVMTNVSEINLPPALCLSILDLLAGRDAGPWGQTFLYREAPRPESPVYRQRKARDLREYAGTYRHPAYDTLEVTVEGDRLVPRFHGIAQSLEHRDLDVFELHLVTFPQRIPVVFNSDGEGRITTAAAELEPLVSPVVFRRDLSSELEKEAVRT